MTVYVEKVRALEIFDSRGNPTVEVHAYLSDGTVAKAEVPSGASTGEKEAVELRDGGKRLQGKGVTQAVANVNGPINDALKGLSPYNQAEIDRTMIKLDGTQNKAKLGANAILGTSMAIARAAARSKDEPLYRYLGGCDLEMPQTFHNVINGGKHADNGIDIQEFMITPVAKNSFRDGSEKIVNTYHALKAVIEEAGFETGLGDEGGFAPNLKNNEEALQLIVKAITEAGYKPGEEVFIAIDAASSEMYNEETKTYSVDKNNLTSDDLMNYYLDLIEKYPIISIEDAFMEDDFESLAKLTAKIGEKIMLVGDDYFVTNKKFLQKAIDMHAGNAILLKANQIGTVSEMMETILLARKNGYKMVISHRSGETEDTFIADLAAGLDIPYIKTGSLSRGERIAKYNRLLRIEEKLMEK